MSDKEESLKSFRPHPMNRRDFLRLATLMGMAAGVEPLLAACGPTAPAATTVPTTGPIVPPTQVPTKAPTAVPATAVPPTNTPVPTPAGPKILKFRNGGDIPGVDPAFMVGYETFVIDIVYSGLVIQKPNSYELVNDLAESIEQSADGLTITFKLREGVKWHKGYGEVTTEDIKFSFERIADPANQSPYASDWGTLDHVEVVDKYNGKIILKSPFSPLWTSTLPVNSGRVVCKKYIEEVGVDKAKFAPIGSGPYLFDTWVPNQKLIMKRNPEYYGEQFYFDEIHFIPIADNMAAEVALEAGEVDFSNISLASAEKFMANKDFKVEKRAPLYYNWIGMNVENPKLQDINVRQAIRYGIDVPQILAAAYFGQAEPEYSLIPPGLLGFWKDAPHYERDVEKAKDFLSKAGLTTLDLTYTCSTTTESKTWAEVTQQNLAEIGINVTINALDPSTAWQAGMGDNGKTLELYGSGFSMYPDPSWATMWFLCDQVGVWNWMRWCNKDFDTMHNQAIAELDPKKREEIYIKMQQLWDESAINVWVTNGANILAFRPNIVPAMTPHGQVQLWYFKGTA